MANIWINKGLRKEIREGIENRRYSRDDIFELHETLHNQYQNRKLGIKRAAIIMGIAFLIMVILTIWGAHNRKTELEPVLFISFGIVGIMLFLIWLFLRQNFVELNKKQFIKALSKGYPELMHQLGEESFEKHT